MQELERSDHVIRQYTIPNAKYCIFASDDFNVPVCHPGIYGTELFAEQSVQPQRSNL